MIKVFTFWFKTDIIMKAKPAPKITQGTFLYPDLLDQLNPRDPLLQLSNKIPWDFFEEEFSVLYADCGRPAKPVRLMVGLLLLKQIENLSDERVVEEWCRNPYYQAFCGMKHFQWELPCEPSDLVHFRKRIGEKGVEKIFQTSVSIHGKDAQDGQIVVDTTVQEKNITFPTDSKLRLKVIAKCWKIADQEGISLRRSYKREVKGLARLIRFTRTKNISQKYFAIRRLKTVANILLRELGRKLPVASKDRLSNCLDIYNKAVNQQKAEKNKVYSLHEAQVYCIAKGKEHKKYEFGNKVAIAQTLSTGIIVGAQNAYNFYDGNTLEPLLDQIEKIRGTRPTTAVCDRGFRGKKEICGTRIEIPGKPKKGFSEYFRKKVKEKFRKRNAIEAVNSHLKYDFRMLRNYLKGTIGDTINLLLSAAAYNFKKWMRRAIARLFIFFFYFFPKKIA